ncbi:hypothetical protein V5799_012730, partial [Amblyomma americanum]
MVKVQTPDTLPKPPADTEAHDGLAATNAATSSAPKETEGATNKVQGEVPDGAVSEPTTLGSPGGGQDPSASHADLPVTVTTCHGSETDA